jgi:integrase
MSTATDTPPPGDGPDDPWPAPDVPILRSRVVRPDAPPERLSRFGDPVWDLQPAHPDAHQGVWAVHWAKFPAASVLPFKTVCLALLDHPVPASPRTLRSGGEVPAVSTVGQHMRWLRVLAQWMHGRGLTRLSELTDRHLDAYRAHVAALACPALRKRHMLATVVLVHAYRDLLPPSCRLGTNSPWDGAAGDALFAVPPVTARVNRTPRIAPATMEALLGWSLLMLENIGPDIVEASRTWRRLRAGVHPSQRGFAGLPIRERLALFLARARREGTALPGKPGKDGRPVLDEHVLCRLLGLDSSYGALRSQLQRSMAAEAGLPLDDGRVPGTTITGTIDGRPWREGPITAREVPDLVRYLTAALFVVVCYLSGQRPGEALNLRLGCRDTDPDTGELLLVGRRGKGRGRTPSAGADLADDVLARPWVVVRPVHDAVALLELLSPHTLLFPSEYGHARPHGDRILARSSHHIAQDIAAFVDWVNTTFVTADAGVPIPADPTKRLHATRFRRIVSA